MSENSSDQTFGGLVRRKRETLNKTVEGFARELGMSKCYLSDIERGNKPAPENFEEQFLRLLGISQTEAMTPGGFYDLAGKSREHHYKDLDSYLGSSEVARYALRRARDLNIPDSKWHDFIRIIEPEQSGKKAKR